jgi:hypothetical protein
VLCLIKTGEYSTPAIAEAIRVSIPNISRIVAALREQAPETLRRTRDRHKASGLQPEEWGPFLIDYKGDVDNLLTKHLSIAQKGMKEWKGVTLSAFKSLGNFGCLRPEIESG